MQKDKEEKTQAAKEMIRNQENDEKVSVNCLAEPMILEANDMEVPLEDKPTIAEEMDTGDRVTEENKPMEIEISVEENSSELQKLINQEAYSLIDEDDLTNPDEDDKSEVDEPTPGLLNRYFSDESNIKCHGCYRRGHSKQYCPLNTLACNYCLGPHERKNCANDLFCYNCGGKDHVRSECKVRDKDKCFRCNKAYHMEKDCYYIVMTGDVVDYYHINNVICLVCGKKGHPNCSVRNNRELYIKSDNLYGSQFRARMYQQRPLSYYSQSKSQDNSLKSFDAEFKKRRPDKSEPHHSHSKANNKVSNNSRDRVGSGHDDNRRDKVINNSRDFGRKRESNYGDSYERGYGNSNQRNRIDMTLESSRSKSGKADGSRYKNGDSQGNRRGRNEHDRRWVDRR